MSLIHTARGQTLIISTLILGFLTLSFVLVSIHSLGQENRADAALENKTLATAAATGCMEQAMNRLGNASTTYTGNESLTVASSTCTIRSITSTSSPWTLETWAQVNDQYTRLRVSLTSLMPPTISSWVEIDSF